VFDRPIANLKHKIDLALKSTVCGVVALAAALVALGFFCAAAFMWLAQAYGAIVAALLVGAAFLIIALLAVIVILILHRRKPPPPATPQKAWWNDPVLLATALDLSRVIGGRKMISIAVVGAFLVGILLNRPPRKRDESDERDP
jgi:putative superfamily III holin-X